MFDRIIGLIKRLLYPDPDNEFLDDTDDFTRGSIMVYIEPRQNKKF